MREAQILGLLFTLVSVVALFSEGKIESSLAHWTNAVLLVGFPLLFMLVASIGISLRDRLKEIEIALRERRGP